MAETMEPERETEMEEASADPPPSDESAEPRDTAAPKRLKSILESLLFAVAEPVAIGKLAQIVPGYERREIVRALGDLAEEYERDERGFRLQQVAGGYQLRTPRANAEFVKALLQQRPTRLSRAALETVAVIAYRQPVTRPEIEAIRGVDVDAVLTTLGERRLIRVLGRKDVPGRPLLYGTTQEFLETFGLKDLSVLPTLEELGASADAFEKAASALEAARGAEREAGLAEPEAQPDGSEPAPIEPAPQPGEEE